MDNKKKLVLYVTIVIIMLLVLIVGASYAYFSVTSTNSFGSKTISASAPSIGYVTLTSGSSLTMNLTAEQMMSTHGNTEYYATPTGTSSNFADAWNEIVRATVTGEGFFNCNYTLEITKSATNDLYTSYQNWTNKEPSQIELAICSTTDCDYLENGYDFYEPNLFNNNKITINGTFLGISSNNPGKLNALFYIWNSDETDQSFLKNKDVTLTFTATSFSCKIASSTYYYVYDEAKCSSNNCISDPLISNEGLTYYLIGDNNGNYSKVCGIFSGTEYCLFPNTWSNASTYYSEMSAIQGVSCNSNYSNNGTLQCENDSVVCSISVNGNAGCASISANEPCTILSSGRAECDIG